MIAIILTFAFGLLVMFGMVYLLQTGRITRRRENHTAWNAQVQ